ncbi:MAG: MMPL family transporter [Treponema sp.]|nr:MMPL family transporter [Treponema sp.]
MKKRSSLFPELKNFWGLWLWLLVHLTVFLVFLVSVFFLGPVSINTRLFDMLPQSGQSRAVMEADMILGEKSGREIVVLAAAPDFQTAKNGAALLYAEFEHSQDFENSSFYFDSSVMAEFSQYLYDYRFVIAGKETLTLLESGRAGEIAEDALASAFGAFNLVPLTHIENDPFFLAERRMSYFLTSSLLSGGNLSLKEDVLTAEKDGTWYVLLRMTLAPEAVSVSSKKNAVGKIYTTAATVKESIPGLEYYFSGIPFHSYESSSGAQKEISLISAITLIIILILFLFVFRSPLPVISSILAAGVSLSLAAMAALFVFREIHIITFVFGTTLIGTCVDYSVHFFVHWKGNCALKDGNQIRSHIAKSIIMCVISTEISFFVFLYAPFSILKQFAVFSMSGLFSSFLTCFCIYPRFRMPVHSTGRTKESKLFLWIKKISLPRATRFALVIAIAVASLVVLVSNFSEIKIKNDLSSLYTMSASLLESEKQTAQVLDYGSPGWYFIVAGSDPEETLEREEYLAARLEKEIEQGNLGSFLGTSVFVPSIKTQRKTYETMKALLPLVPAQFEYLGFPQEYAESFIREFAAVTRYGLPEDAPSQAGISNLWIGEQGENCYSCVIPLHPAVDEAVFRSIAGEFEFVHFVNKVQDIGINLDILTKTMLFFFLIAYIVISIIICIVYPWRDALKICTAPLFMALLSMAVLVFNGINFGFFSAAALVLVFGLGMDYAFYITGKKDEEDKNRTSMAVVLSFLTTFLSFGALALSSFMPVHIFGLTVSAGLSGAFIFAMLLQNRETCL